MGGWGSIAKRANFFVHIFSAGACLLGKERLTVIQLGMCPLQIFGNYDRGRVCVTKLTAVSFVTQARPLS